MPRVKGKCNILLVAGPGGQEQFAENTPGVGLSMECKMCQESPENITFCWSLDLEDSSNSQKIHLEWASVWNARCAESQGKCSILLVTGPGGQEQFAENTPRVGLSMECKMCEYSKEMHHFVGHWTWRTGAIRRKHT